MNQDFYNYVNSEWLDKTKLPSGYSKWGTFNILQENNINCLKNQLERHSKIKNSEFQKLCILYNQSIKNLDDSKSTNYINHFLNKINQVNNKTELKNFINNEYFLYGISLPINYYVYLDLHSPTYILHLGTGGLGLPDKDYYLKEEHKETLSKYKSFMKKYLGLFMKKLSSKKLDDVVDSIIKLEKQFANNFYSVVEKRNPSLSDNSETFTSFNLKYKELEINNILKLINPSLNDIKINDIKINVTNPSFIKNKNGTGYIDLWNNLSLDIWKSYYTWVYLLEVGSFINSKAEKIIFDFYRGELEGIKEMKDRWKISIDNCELLMGQFLGKLYVSEFFKDSDKKEVTKMIEFIKETLEKRFLKNDWMSEETKSHAIKKLSKMKFKIGYPNKWRDFSNYNVNKENSFLQNCLNCMYNEVKYQNSKLGKDKDNDEWFMSQYSVNAYYSPDFNEIVFPAGILQDPFFSVNNDIGTNYGGIGCVISHEIIHGFDDQGRQYDGNGKLCNWWTKEDVTKYKKKTDKLVRIFSNKMMYGKNINGNLTLGENIADLGGVTISYYSLLNYLEKNNLNYNEKIYKNFFINYARIWKSIITKEATIKRIMIDPHSPPKLRVNTTLPLFSEFYKHFNIPENSKMYSNEKISIF